MVRAKRKVVMRVQAVGQEVEIEIEAPSAGKDALLAVLGSVRLIGPAPIVTPFDDEHDEAEDTAAPASEP
jgi:hypothetical protein